MPEKENTELKKELKTELWRMLRRVELLCGHAELSEEAGDSLRKSLHKVISIVNLVNERI